MLTKNRKEVVFAMLSLHKFFGIFLSFNKNVSRPVRFSLYFLKIMALMAVSGIFSQVKILFKIYIYIY